jgi:hypothetical protein
MPHETRPIQQEDEAMDRQFAQEVLRLLCVSDEESAKATDHISSITIEEANWFEDAEQKFFDGLPTPDANFLIDPHDTLTAMQTKQRCRQLLSATAYREIGWPALAVFDRALSSLGTGKDWIQPTGWANVPPENGCGLLPSLLLCQAAVWASGYINAVKARDPEYAGKSLCKLAYLVTVFLMAFPQPPISEQDQPSAEVLAR